VTIYHLDPIQDPRWKDLADRSRTSTLFHSPNWLKALQLTYGYEAVAVTDAAPGEPLRNGVVYCPVKSWITGRRIVSLPFSDHCDPLTERGEAVPAILEFVKALVGSGFRYAELRPREAMMLAGFDVAAEFWLHRLDLSGGLSNVLARFHQSHMRRAIRKAERRGVQCEAGRSPELLRAFYTLHVMTRRRYGAPIQPLSWFRQLTASFGDALTIHLARHEGQPLAAILTIQWKDTLVYKYGGSDHRRWSQGAMPLLFWRVIQDAHAAGLAEIDLGRSDTESAGLVAFKDHLGARRTRLRYYRYGVGANTFAERKFVTEVAKRVSSVVPSALHASVSGRLYRHLA
jgi:CelD/BcsL family acetyltransferase involved in cellulose biosynthesis